MDISMKLVIAAGLAGSLAACSPAADEAEPAQEAVETPAEAAAAPEEGVEEEAAAEAPPGMDIHIHTLSWADGVPSLGGHANGVMRPGYDNQPFFTPDGSAMLYSAGMETDTDILSLDLATGETTNLTNTPVESEYSPRYLPDGSGISYIHQAEGGYGGQVYRAALDGSAPQAAFEYGPLGYYVFSQSMDQVVVFALGEESNTLQHIDLGGGEETATLISDQQGRAITPALTGNGVFYTLARADEGNTVHFRNYDTGESHEVMDLPGQSQDYALVRSGNDWDEHGFFAADGGVLYYTTPGNDWVAVAELAYPGVTRLAVNEARDMIAIVAAE